MRRDSEFNPELGAYMAQQFGVPTEKKKQRRKSTTLGGTVAATLLAKRMKVPCAHSGSIGTMVADCIRGCSRMCRT